MDDHCTGRTLVLDKYRKLSTCLALLALLFVPFSLPAADTEASEAEFATTLLKKIISTRESIPASRLEGRIAARQLVEPVSESKTTFTVEFDGEKRRIDLVTNYLAPVALVRRVRMSFDGEGIKRYHRSGNNPVGTVSLLDVDDSRIHDYFVDPRILGLTSSPSVRLTPETTVPSAGPVVECDRISDADENGAWAVTVQFRSGVTMKYLLRPDPAYQVFEHHVVHQNHTEHIKSEFRLQDYPWLPSRVEITKENRDGIYSVKVIEIDRATMIDSLTEEDFTIAALEPRVGSTVMDVAARQRLGLWDGEGGLMDRIPADVWRDYTGDTLSTPQHSAMRRAILISVVVGFFILPVILFWTVMMRGRQEKGDM